MKNSIYAFMLVMMMLSITSCSTKLAYNNLDWLASWYVDDYVNLTDSQEDEFDTKLDAFLVWHRNIELQNYILQIKAIQADFNKGVTLSDIESYVTSVKTFLDVALTKAEPEVVALAYSLSDQQAGSFLVEFEQQNLDKIERFEQESKERRTEKRLEKFEEQLSSFIGRLNAQQKKLLNDGNNQLLSSFQERIQFRRQWADSIRGAYVIRARSLGDTDKKKKGFELALKQSILELNSLRSDKYSNILDHNQRVRVNTLYQIITSLNEKQLKHLNEKINEIIGDLEALL
ncbi:DUF6279 family lipoprotein [uncultured Psychromonas sp.]|uniref:DUF6279 family lipoprotein n=1 Tax=uncultured Psychromonas sp. TaxID=173974 RepID=UPI00260A3B94|nr:DUF6279 family lipoprotein [uncultured Psychromonas sp.]